jgi:hypothetical protein
MDEMTNASDVKETYKFEHNKTYNDGEQHTNVKIFTVNDDFHTYEDILRSFTTWLGSAYGYDLTRLVSVNGVPLDSIQTDAEATGRDSATAAQNCPGCAY